MRKKFLKSLSILMLLTLTLFTSLYLHLPRRINILEGTSHNLKLKLPFKISVLEETQNVINVKNAENKDENFIIEAKEKGSTNIQIALGFIPIKKVELDVIPNIKLMPVGRIVGLRIFSEGLMVLGSGYVMGEDGIAVEPSKKVLFSGDVILEVNNKTIKRKEDLISEIENSNGDEMTMKVKRNGILIDAEAIPIKSMEDGKYKLGLWVRDSTQGIGTVTYYNQESDHIGILGHGIMDVDTNRIIEVERGKVLKTTITSIKKGQKGKPGEIMGVIVDTPQSEYGEIQNNTEYGMFAVPNTRFLAQNEGTYLPIAMQNDVVLGKAYILSDILGDKVEKFEINIEEINKYEYNISKGMIIRITDKRLLEETNGIIQGMSGSPIIQNDKIIGAVTHVFVQDSTKGYGIFIENMIKQEKTS